uniref:Uncharacterized protein n=1 Tax=Eutreptiella gymnastica TaxID=73025 RepID=A0A7S1IPJ0_9EUGL|mmetsp:Transcript_32058/g.57483  ORF Transcript_32058/g.57483 Transcript_32058/m.57483 type:complete len:1366 (+) Transcript_32058:87-4184(+)
MSAAGYLLNLHAFEGIVDDTVVLKQSPHLDATSQGEPHHDVICAGAVEEAGEASKGSVVDVATHSSSKVELKAVEAMGPSSTSGVSQVIPHVEVEGEKHTVKEEGVCTDEEKQAVEEAERKATQEGKQETKEEIQRKAQEEAGEVKNNVEQKVEGGLEGPAKEDFGQKVKEEAVQEAKLDGDHEAKKDIVQMPNVGTHKVENEVVRTAQEEAKEYENEVSKQKSEEQTESKTKEEVGQMSHEGIELQANNEAVQAIQKAQQKGEEVVEHEEAEKNATEECPHNAEKEAGQEVMQDQQAEHAAEQSTDKPETNAKKEAEPKGKEQVECKASVEAEPNAEDGTQLKVMEGTDREAKKEVEHETKETCAAKCMVESVSMDKQDSLEPLAEEVPIARGLMKAPQHTAPEGSQVAIDLVAATSVPCSLGPQAALEMAPGAATASAREAEPGVSQDMSTRVAPEAAAVPTTEATDVAAATSWALPASNQDNLGVDVDAAEFYLEADGVLDKIAQLHHSILRRKTAHLSQQQRETWLQETMALQQNRRRSTPAATRRESWGCVVRSGMPEMAETGLDATRRVSSVHMETVDEAGPLCVLEHVEAEGTMGLPVHTMDQRQLSGMQSPMLPTGSPNTQQATAWPEAPTAGGLFQGPQQMDTSGCQPSTATAWSLVSGSGAVSASCSIPKAPCAPDNECSTNQPTSQMGASSPPASSSVSGVDPTGVPGYVTPSSLSVAAGSIHGPESLPGTPALTPPALSGPGEGEDWCIPAAGTHCELPKGPQVTDDTIPASISVAAGPTHGQMSLPMTLTSFKPPPARPTDAGLEIQHQSSKCVQNGSDLCPISPEFMPIHASSICPSAEYDTQPPSGSHPLPSGAQALDSGQLPTDTATATLQTPQQSPGTAPASNGLATGRRFCTPESAQAVLQRASNSYRRSCSIDTLSPGPGASMLSRSASPPHPAPPRSTHSATPGGPGSVVTAWANPRAGTVTPKRPPSPFYMDEIGNKVYLQNVQIPDFHSNTKVAVPKIRLAAATRETSKGRPHATVQRGSDSHRVPLSTRSPLASTTMDRGLGRATARPPLLAPGATLIASPVYGHHSDSKRPQDHQNIPRAADPHPERHNRERQASRAIGSAGCMPTPGCTVQGAQPQLPRSAASTTPGSAGRPPLPHSSNARPPTLDSTTLALASRSRPENSPGHGGRCASVGHCSSVDSLAIKHYVPYDPQSSYEQYSDRRTPLGSLRYSEVLAELKAEELDIRSQRESSQSPPPQADDPDLSPTTWQLQATSPVHPPRPKTSRGPAQRGGSPHASSARIPTPQQRSSTPRQQGPPKRSQPSPRRVGSARASRRSASETPSTSSLRRKMGEIDALLSRAR